MQNAYFLAFSCSQVVQGDLPGAYIGDPFKRGEHLHQKQLRYFFQ